MTPDEEEEGLSMTTYKIVVIENEPLLLRNIKRTLKEAHSGFDIVGEAMNGEDGLFLIESLRPDVVFTDIRMPIMDGLTLIQEIRARGLQPHVVILSGHQEFDYAKRALKMDVEDYLLKPLSVNELKPLMDNLHAKLTKHADDGKRRILQDLVNRDSHDLPNDVVMTGRFSEYRAFVPALYCAGSYSTFDSNWLTPAKQYWLHQDLDTLAGSHLPAAIHRWVLEPKHSNERLLLLGIRANGDGELEARIRDAAQNIFLALCGEQMPITAVIGTNGCSLLDLPYVLRTMRIRLSQGALFGQSSIITPVFNEAPSAQEVLLEPNEEKALVFSIENDHIELFKSTFRDILERYRSTHATQWRLAGMLKRVIGLFHGRNLNVTFKRLTDIELEIDELITNSILYPAVSGGMMLILEELFAFHRKQTDKPDSTAIVEEVVVYLRQRYAEPISLQATADHFGIGLTHLTRLFKKHKGMPPMEYLIGLRIEKAKELLKLSPPMTIKEIGQTIGYEDPYYMSRVFKSVTGISPSEYRSGSGSIPDTPK